MSGFWKGYAAVNDDVRHTYERVFYGRETTRDLTETDMPALGEKPAETPQQVQERTDAAPEAAEASHAHAEFYGGIWGETLPPEPEAGGVHGAPQLDAPTIEAPKIEPPNQGDDMTPGY